MRKSPELLALLSDLQSPLPKLFSSVEVGGITAVYLMGGQRILRTRRALLRRVHQRQLHLETLMRQATVLPVLLGSRLPSAVAKRALGANLPELKSWAAQLRGKQQYQLIISLLDEAEFDATSHAGKALLCNLNARLESALLPVADDILELPIAGAALTNHVLLLDETRTSSLDRALEEVDAIWSEGLKIKLIGPAPAASFCSVGFRKIAPKAISQAAGLLGLNLSGEPQDVAGALKSRLRQQVTGHSPEELRAAARLCEVAQRTKAPGAVAWQAYAWSEGRAESDTVAVQEVA